MAKDWGIKVSRPGFNVQDASPDELGMSSKFGSFKIAQRGAGSMASNSGGGLVTIPHGLGYVPMFLVHVDPGQLGQYYIAPYGTEDEQIILTYADSTNLYIKINPSVSTTQYFMQNGSQDSGREISGLGTFTNGWGVGQTSGGGIYYGACRFPNFNQSGSVGAASLNLYIADRDGGSGEVKSNVWGIDHDNWGPFNGSGSNPTAGPKTSAVTVHNSTVPVGQYSGANVTSQVNEILARGGWSSGNAIAMMFWDNGSSAGNIYLQISSIINTNLEITNTTHNVANYKYTIFLNQLE